MTARHYRPVSLADLWKFLPYVWHDMPSRHVRRLAARGSISYRLDTEMTQI